MQEGGWREKEERECRRDGVGIEREEGESARGRVERERGERVQEGWCGNREGGGGERKREGGERKRRESAGGMVWE